MYPEELDNICELKLSQFSDEDISLLRDVANHIPELSDIFNELEDFKNE